MLPASGRITCYSSSCNPAVMQPCSNPLQAERVFRIWCLLTPGFISDWHGHHYAMMLELSYISLSRTLGSLEKRMDTRDSWHACVLWNNLDGQCLWASSSLEKKNHEIFPLRRTLRGSNSSCMDGAYSTPSLMFKVSEWPQLTSSSMTAQWPWTERVREESPKVSHPGQGGCHVLLHSASSKTTCLHPPL